MKSSILWVSELSDESLPKAGSKIARLGELARCGVKVPDGFAVTTEVFEAFMASSGAGKKVEALMSSVSDPDDADAISEVSSRARAEVEGAELSADVAEMIVEAYDELSYRGRDLNIPVAVRSSATGEDAKDASFAGQFDTYLGITGGKRLVDAVQRCWASLFTDRAVEYRLRKGLDYRESPMAVGVLRLVHAMASGVAFSIHPVTGNKHRMVIEGSWGWGEAVVQGLVTPDHVEVDKDDSRILEYQVADKKVVSCFDYEVGLVVEHDMPRRLRNERILTDEQVQGVVDAVRCIEARYGYPVDVEWVLDRHRRDGEPMTIVQTRPITVKTEEPKPQWNPVAYANKYAFGKR
ncbi:MAG: PEP/pyruvate-binding domain-containing protein [Deltaproteobacteria bacterium]